MRLVLIAGDFLWYALGSEAVGDTQDAAGDKRQAQQGIKDTGATSPELMDECGGAIKYQSRLNRAAIRENSPKAIKTARMK